MSKDIKTMPSEEEEALQRDPKADLDLFHTCCDYLKKSIRKTKELKCAESDKSLEIRQLRTDATLQFIQMKKLNRLAHFRCRRAREGTSEAKLKVDSCHLQLQNLLYEAMHFQKEITKCLEFKSKDEEIELVSLEEFYDDAPKSISKPEVTRDNSHQQMLARLEWELEQRKQLSVKLREKQASREKIGQEIQAKQDYLETLQPKLAAILEATRPVQDYLAIPYDTVKEEYQKAHHLPAPLYILYMQTSAYKEACGRPDKGMAMSIEGDVEAAKSILDVAIDLDDDSDSDQDDQEKGNSKRRRKNQQARQSEKKSHVLQKHPLSVELKISTQDNASLSLTFHYLRVLKIVTVDVKVDIGSKVNVSTINGGELLSPDLILDELYPGDHGRESPNVANHFELRKYGLHELSDYLTVVGRPYLWCQWMGGLHFLSKDSATATDMGSESNNPFGSRSADLARLCDGKARHRVSASHMQGTVDLLRRRLQARVSLTELFSSIERGIIPLSQESTRLFPAKVNAKLTSWRRATYSGVKHLNYARRAVRAGVVGPSDFIYAVSVEHVAAKLTAYVILTADSPHTVPFFILDLSWRSLHCNALNDIHIMELEEELNLHHMELQPSSTNTITTARSHILALQLQRLLTCFDVYLETWRSPSPSGSQEVPQEKMMPRLTRGRSRSKPYKYIPELGIFTQRM